MALPIAPRGLVADLITPLKADRSIDETGLERLLKRVAPHVQALLLASPHIGEGTALDPAQRRNLLERTRAFLASSPMPVMVWVTQDTREETHTTLRLLSQSLEPQGISVPVFWVDTPLYYHSNRGLPEHYRVLCAASKQPFILHNDPQVMEAVARPFKRRNIRTAILKELATIEGMAGLLFSGTMERAHHYRKACRPESRFRIYDGDESHFLDHPSMSGTASPGANLAPRAWHTITRSSLQLSDSEKVYPDHLQQIWELGEYLRNLRDLYRPSPVPAIKGVLAHMDIIETPTCTIPQKDMTHTVEKMLHLLGQFGDA
ncbi:MAG: dihydrodipicolinate synthase family protein [Desulfobacteraceae bacterium]